MKITAGKKTYIWSFIGQIISLGANLAIYPVLMMKLSQSYMGLWNLFFAVGAIVTLFDSSFAPALARNIAYIWSGSKEVLKKGVSTKVSEIGVENNVDPVLLKKILVTSRFIYLIIAIGSFLILNGGVTWFIIAKSSDLDLKIYLSAWFIYSLSLSINLLYFYFSSFLRGIGDIVSLSRATIISKLVYIGLAILSLFLGFGIIGIAVSALVSGLLFRIICKHQFYKNKTYLSIMKDNLYKVTKKDIQEVFAIIWYNSWREGLIAFANYLSGQAIVIVVTISMSIDASTVYSIPSQLVAAVGTVALTFFISTQPSLQSSYATGDKKRVVELFSSSVFAYFIIFIIGVLGIYLVALPIFKLIRPENEFNYLLIGLMLTQEFLVKHHSLHCSYFSSTNRLPYVISFVVFGILGILLTFLLGQTALGVYVFAIGPLVSQLIFNNWYWPSRVYKELNQNFFSLIKEGAKSLYQTYLKKDKQL